MDYVKGISHQQPGITANIMARLQISPEKCCVIKQVSRDPSIVVRALVTNGRLHYPAARSKVVISDLAPLFGTMPSAPALIQGYAGAAMAGSGLYNFDVNMA
jgi:hypothetical protein